MTLHTATPGPARHQTERVRHELVRRMVRVARIDRLTPKMIRITLAGPDLAGFASAAYDDHVKLFFPKPGEARPFLPATGPDGRTLVDEADRPVARDYTPRHFDPATNELEIDFVVHAAGPATEWAIAARPGSEIGIGGPRGSLVVPDDFDWYLFVGDETALPAIGRRLAELRPGVRCIVLAEVASVEEEPQFESLAEVETIWLHRGAAEAGSTTGLDDALSGLTLPSGEGYAWVACESTTARRLRRVLVETHAQSKAWLKAAGYWRRGVANSHETIQD